MTEYAPVKGISDSLAAAEALHGAGAWPGRQRQERQHPLPDETRR